MSDTNIEETTPDQLMNHFQGSSLKTIIFFTVVVHAVLLGGTSIPYLYRTIVGEDTAEMTEEQRTDAAMRKAKAAILEISEEYGFTAQDLSSKLAGGAPKISAPAKTDDKKDDTPVEQPPAQPDPEKEKSSIEKEISVKAKGPTVPTPEDNEEDLFE